MSADFDQPSVLVWKYFVSCEGCLSVVHVELPFGARTFVLFPAPHVARLRERLARAREEGRLEAEINALRLTDQFFLLGIPELFRDARAGIPEEVRLVANAGWWAAPPPSPLGLDAVVPTSLRRESFAAKSRDLLRLPSGGGIVAEFKSFVAGTRFRVTGIRRGELRVEPLDFLPPALGVPSLCASFGLVGNRSNA